MVCITNCMVANLPVIFYGSDSIIYFICAAIGFLISFKAFTLHEITNQKEHYYLHLSFCILSIGLLIISMTSAFAYLNFFTQDERLIFDDVFDVSDLGYWIYFFSSMIAYSILILMYFPKNDKLKFLPIALPVSVRYFSYMNIVLFLLVGFLAFRSIAHYFSKKTDYCKYVMFSFVLIAIYHATAPFTLFHKAFYIISHISLILGFLSLLIMLAKVSKC